MKTVFLDRDGVINRNRPDHVKSWEEFEFLPGSLSGLAKLYQAGYQVFVITNQAIVGRGLISETELNFIHEQMKKQVAEAGGRIEEVLFCPHRLEDGCQCRKPAPGLIEQAGLQYNLCLKDSWLIGDHESDILAGQQVGCRTIMVLSGRGSLGGLKVSTAVTINLRAAVELIVGFETTFSSIGNNA